MKKFLVLYFVPYVSEAVLESLVDMAAVAHCLFQLVPLEGLPSSPEMMHHGDEEISLNIPQFSFRPYDCKLPNLVRARVTGRIGRKLYMVRDVEILTYLYEVLI